MKICFAIGTLSYSGAEKILFQLIKKLIERNHEISVILISCESDVDNLQDIKQYPVFDNEEEASKNRIKRVLNRIKRIRKVLQDNEFDLVVSFGVKYNLDVVLSNLFLNTPLILCERNDPKCDPRKKSLRLRRKITYPLADGFIFQTSTIKKFFSNYVQKKSRVIPNFIEEGISIDKSADKKIKSFVTSARLDDNQKNQSLLIDAFYEFCKSNEEYILEFFGAGPDKEKYIALVKEYNLENRVVFHGKIENPSQEIQKREIFILTSNYEGMPNSLIEALACGMPCISTDCGGGGAAALIDNGKNGILIPVKDKNILVASMDSLANNYLLQSKLSKEALKINDKLQLSNIIDEWEAAFYNV